MLTKEQREKILEVVRERDELKVQLANSERKAVERERTAAEWVLRHFDVSLPDSYSEPVLADLRAQLTREIDRRYPMPEE